MMVFVVKELFFSLVFNGRTSDSVIAQEPTDIEIEKR